MQEHRRPDERWATFADEAAASQGHPLIATIIGCLLLLLTIGTGGGSPMDPAADPSEARIELLVRVMAGAAAGALIVGGLAYAVTIRKASTGWKIGSLIAITLVSSLASLARVGVADAAAQESARNDARDAARMLKQALDSGENPPERVDAGGGGPITRMSAASINSMLADRRSFDREAQAAGVVQLLSAERLTRSSPMLDHCDRFSGVAGRARINADRWSVHLGAARAVGEAAVREGQLSASAVEAVTASFERRSPDFRRLWILDAQIAEEAAAICRVLAARRWVMEGGRVMFNRESDYSETNARLARVRAHLDEQQRLRAQSRADMRENIEEMMQ